MMVFIDIRCSRTIDLLAVDLREEERAANVLEVVTLQTIHTCRWVLAHGYRTDELILDFLLWQVQEGPLRRRGLRRYFEAESNLATRLLRLDEPLMEFSLQNLLQVLIPHLFLVVHI